MKRVAALPPRRGALASVEHCFVAAAADLDMVELVTAGDWLVRSGWSSPAGLAAYAASTSAHGCRAARRAAGLVRDRVDSPQETRLRLCLVLAGLPEPACNVVIGSELAPIGRVDLLLEAYKTIIEYEGDQHRTDRRQWNTDIDRAEAFTEEGYVVMRVTAARMCRPRSLVMRIWRVISDRGYAGPAPTFNEEWCALFEEGGR